MKTNVNTHTHSATLAEWTLAERLMRYVEGRELKGELKGELKRGLKRGLRGALTLIGVLSLSALHWGCESSSSAEESTLTVTLSPCLGDAERGCQAQLRASASASGSGAGCFMLSVDNVVALNTAVRWSASGLELIDPPRVELNEGQSIQPVLYLSAGEEQIECTQLSLPPAPCERVEGCAARLLSPVTDFNGGELVIDFKTRTESCNLELVSSALPEEVPEDGIDNDCNGEVDEVMPEPCRDACDRRVPMSMGEGGELICNPPELFELCSEIGDEDCDGISDEGFDLNGDPCNYQGNGPQTGVWVCDNTSKRELVCAPKAPPAMCLDDESDLGVSCDGEDNDCDGSVDEDFPAEGISMPNLEGCGQGECAAQSYTFCEDGQRITTCRERQLPVDEVCDGLDNDCDGVVDDETCPPDEDLNERYQCLGDAEGRWSCEFTECEPGFGPTYNEMSGVVEDRCGCMISEELCDGADNDCDGRVDEREEMNLLDACDAVDDDCDGLLDEGRDSGVSGFACSEGALWANRCSSWFSLFRNQNRELVGAPPTGEMGYLKFATVASDVYNLNPSFNLASTPNDQLLPGLECTSPLDAGWIEWISRSCRTSVIQNGRMGIDPWTCHDESGEVSERCSHSGMVLTSMMPSGEVIAPLVTGPVNRISLGVTCRVELDGLSEFEQAAERLKLITFMNHYGVQLGLYQNPNSDYNAQVFCSSQTGSYNSCNQLNLTCGEASLDLSRGPAQVTRWSSLGGYNRDANGLCPQPLFGSFVPNSEDRLSE